jgi:uncharacterized protein YjiS (DUF1127 family)
VTSACTNRQMKARAPWQGRKISPYRVKAAEDVTTVTSIARAGMLWKHARDRIFLVKMTREKSMPRTKPLFDASRLAPFPRLHEIDQSTPRRAGFRPDEAPRVLSKVDSAPHPEMSSVATATSRLMFKVVSYSAESVPVLLFAVVSWLVAEAQAGFAAYAMAMHPTPAAMDDPSKPGDPKPSTPTSDARKPRLLIISTDMEHDSERHARRLPSEPARIQASACGPADDMMQPTQTNSILASWHAAIGMPAVALLSKLRQVRARRQAIAELQSLDDRSLRDIGISRGAIQNVIRCG